MTTRRNDRMKGGAFQSDSRLDGRLYDLDCRLTKVFAANLDDHDQRALFRASVVGRIASAWEHTEPEASVPMRAVRRCKKAWTVSVVACTAFVITIVVAVHGLHVQSRIPGASIAALEKPDLKFSLMTTTDLVPFWLAVENNYFKDAGFTFDAWKDVTRVASGTDSVAKLTNNEVDVAYSTYTPFITAKSQGTVDIKLIAAASSAGPGSCMVMATPGSRVKSLKDMAGARVAVTAKNTISDLLIRSVLKSAGVDWTRIEWVEVPFKDMAGKLAIGEVDAAFMTEPFLSLAKKTIGATPVFDTAPLNSPTANIPTAGFGANADFIRKYPKTVAAFQKVMARATAEARADRGKVERLLQKTTDVDADTAKIATLLTFQSDIDVTAIQRVVDLMGEFGMVDRRVNASQLIADVPSGR